MSMKDKIIFKEIDWDNLSQVLNLKMREDQRSFLPDVKTFLSQAYVNLRLGYKEIVYAINYDEHIVGFTKVVYAKKAETPYCFPVDCYLIDAFLIDEQFQKQTIGKQVFKKLLSHLLKFPIGDVDDFYLICHEQNHQAHHFFESFGFKHVDIYQKNDHIYRVYNLKVK